MTTILPAARSSWDVIGQQVGDILGQNLPRSIEKGYERQLGLNAIDNLQKELAESGGDMSKVLPAVARAVSLNKNLERSGYIEHALNMAKNLNAQKIPRPGEEEPFQPSIKQNLPGFMQQPGQEKATQQNPFFPTNQPGGEGPGHLSQTATTGKVIPLLTPSQKIPVIKKLVSDSIKAGVPMNYQQARDEVNAIEEDKKNHNLAVEEENKREATSQREYGNKGVEQLLKVFPDATPEMQAIQKKKAEEYAASGKGKSEADIDRYLATEAKNFKNLYSNVQKDLSAPRLQNQLQRAFLQSSKDFNQAAADLRVKLKPLLGLGLYDTARNLLTDLGYYPEEREQIINPMGEKETTVLNRVPKAQRRMKTESPIGIHGFGTPYIYEEGQKENIEQGLNDLYEANPNFSLPLARKSFEDKGYDWRIFKDAFNDFENRLEQEEKRLSTDQQNQRAILDTPPLNLLEKVLHGLNLIGR
jgi:hypothetical protein